jgi:hypothetical protein
VPAPADVGRLILNVIEVAITDAGDDVLLTGICRSMDATADTEAATARSKMSASARVPPAEVLEKM